MFHRVKSETTSDTSKNKDEKAASDAVAARPKSASSLSRYSTTKNEADTTAVKDTTQSQQSKAQTTQGTVTNKTAAPQKAHSYLQVAKEKTQGTPNQEASNQPKPITNAAPKPSLYSTAIKKDTAPMTQTASTKTETSTPSLSLIHI